jgi:hypothetical protein
MSSQELGERMICSAARVSSHKVRTGALTGDDYAKLIQVVGELEKADIFIDDSAGLNMFELRAKARRLAAKKSLGLVIVDTAARWATDGPGTAAGGRHLARWAVARGRDPRLAVSQLNCPLVRQDSGRSADRGSARRHLVTTGEREKVPIRDLAGNAMKLWTVDQAVSCDWHDGRSAGAPARWLQVTKKIRRSLS